MERLSINTIVTHERPHYDECAAIWMIKKFGQELFGSAVASAKIVFQRNGWDDQDPIELEKQGILLLGIGHGRFDEHPGMGSKRKEDECCASLVAKALGIWNDPQLEHILRTVLEDDLRGKSKPFELGYVAKQLNSLYPTDSEKVLDWVSMGLDAKYSEQGQFLDASSEFTGAKIYHTVMPDGRKIKIAALVSDSEKVKAYALSNKGAGCDILVKKNSAGNAQVFGKKVFLDDVAQMARLFEQYANGGVRQSDWSVLRSEGQIPEAENWYYQRKGSMLLNGSLTANGVRPTRLGLDQLVDIVMLAFSADFEPSRAKVCEAGHCSSTKKSPCFWRQWGISRCRKVRSKEHEEKRQAAKLAV